MGSNAKNKKNSASRSRRKAPVSLTGGEGFRFENSVAARFLLDMLIGKNSLGADFGRVVRVDWQVRDLGWHTDDLAVTSQIASGEERTAGLSIKSYKQLSRNGFHSEFSTVARQQWHNENTKRNFRRGTDAVALITGDLADDVAQAWSDLQKQASQSTPERVIARLETNNEEGSQASNLQRVIFGSLRPSDTHDGEQRAEDAHDRILLIRDIRVLRFDYEAQASSDYAQSLLDCQNCLSSGDASAARTLWERLVGIADEKRPVGGSLDLAGLLTMLRGQFQFAAHPDFRSDWQILARRSADATSNISDAINGNARLARDDELKNIAACLLSNRTCLLVGESGSGKSAIAKRLSNERYGQAVWFSGDDLDHKVLVDFERAVGLNHSLNQVLIASPQMCLIVFDGIEGYSLDALGMAVRVIRELFANPAAQHIHVLLTIQFEAAARLMRQLAQLGMPDTALTTHTLPLASVNELDTLLSSLPQLSWVALRPELRPLLRNLKVLEMVARTLSSEKSLGNRSFVGLTNLIDILWEDWIEHREDGRSYILKEVATQEADRLSNGISRQSLGFSEQQALPGLANSGLVRLKDERIVFAHDLLGDWARLRVLIGDDGSITSSTNLQRTQSPRWHKSIRLFGQRILEQASDIEQWRAVVENTSDESSSATLIRDLFLESLFLATNAVALFERVWPILISNDGTLLRRLLDRFLFTATLPDIRALTAFSDDEEAMRFAHLVRVPYWPYWASLLTVLHAHRDAVVQHAPYEAARICALWLRTTPFEFETGEAMPWRKEAAELALAIGREIQARNEEGAYWSRGADRTVYEAVLYSARDLPTEVAELCLELAKRRELSPAISERVQKTRRMRREQQEQSQKESRKVRGPVMGFPRGRLNPPWPDGPASDVDRDFREACIDGTAFANLAQSRPDIAVEVLLAVCIEEPQHDDYGRSSVTENTGLAYSHNADPSMYFRGPFLQFLRVAPEHGIEFALRLVNFATRCCIGDRFGETLEIEGRPKLWLGDNRVFRWHHDWPLAHTAAALQSTLMALERWFYEQIEAGRNVEAAAMQIVSESESVAFAGVLFDVGKKLPSLFAGALRPLFSSWVFWWWDFQISRDRANGQAGPLGYWGAQPQQMIKLARDWYAMSHRGDMLLTLNGAIPRTMLSKQEFRSFFEEVRTRWKAALDAEEDTEKLGPLIERINPDNYTFSSEGEPIDFQWPATMAREHEEQLRQIGRDQSFMQFPFRCRKVLVAGKPLPESQLLPIFEWLQSLEANPPEIPSQGGEPIQRLENVLLGGISVLVVLHLDWLLADESRITWCRTKLEAIHANPPLPLQFDSEIAIGDERWDDFAAECGIRLLIADKFDPLARKLVAQGVMGFHYGTIGLTMARAFSARAEIGDDFPRLIMLCVRWSALRVLSWISRDLGGENESRWKTEKDTLETEFVSREMSIDIPDFKQINAETLVSHNALYEKQHPDFQPRSRAKERTLTIGSSGRGREKLYPEKLAFDARVLTSALAWLDPGQAQSVDERARFLALIHILMQVSLGTIPVVDDPRNQEIEGLPSDFDGWVYEVVTRAIPQLKLSEKPENLWQPILDLGPDAHDWVERFFWYWFTNGLRSASSPTDFVRIWRSMIIYALANSRWHRAAYGSYRLDGMVIELLGTDSRWNALAADSTYAPVLATMVDVFAQAADQWFAMPRVLRNFLYFIVQPAATQFLRPAILWVSKAVAAYSSYDWRDGIEDGLIEYLDVCWRREQLSILETPEVKDAFFQLLTCVVSRGSHAAIALRDRIAGSTVAEILH